MKKKKKVKLIPVGFFFGGGMVAGARVCGIAVP